MVVEPDNNASVGRRGAERIRSNVKSLQGPHGRKRYGTGGSVPVEAPAPNQASLIRLKDRFKNN